MMSIRKAVWGLWMCVSITLSASAQALALFQYEPVEPATPEFQYRIHEILMEADSARGTGENSNYLPWNRPMDIVLPLAAGYPGGLSLFQHFRFFSDILLPPSPPTGLHLPALGENEASDVNISGFIHDEAGAANILVIPDMFMQAQWRPTESNLHATPFTPHSYSGNAAPARNTVRVCAELRGTRRNKLELRDGDCTGIGGGSGGSRDAANRNGSRVADGSSANFPRNARGSGAAEGGYPGGGGGGAGGGPDAAAPRTDEGGNGSGIPGAVGTGGSNQGNENGGAGEGSGGSGGIGGNEDWGSGNGDTGNWNNPGEGEGPPPSEVATIPEPATLALLALGVVVMSGMRRNHVKPVG